MGEILSFSKFSSSASRAPRALGEAEILFFLGVRYERFPDAPTLADEFSAPRKGASLRKKTRPENTAGKPAQKRKKLDLSPERAL